LRPAEMIAFRVTMPTHTDTRARALVSANIDERKHARAYSHIRGSHACIRERLPSCERAHTIWNGEGDVSIFRQFIRLDRWTSATGGKSLRF